MTGELESEPKFTKGEKCVFVHVLSTLLIIIVFVIIFAVHIYLISHTQFGIFDIEQRSLNVAKGSKPMKESESHRVGYLYLNLTTAKIICNTLLLQPHRSLCTAHCVRMRTEPYLVHLLFAWGLKYKIGTGSNAIIFDTGIKESVAHPLFSRETFAYNIGLLEHTVAVPLLVPIKFLTNHEIAWSHVTNIVIVSWNHSADETSTMDDRGNNHIEVGVIQNSRKDCVEALTPVMIIRENEFCVTLVKSDFDLDYGAIIFSNSIPIGLFAWGERNQRELPMVVLNLTLFHDWINL